MTRTVHQFRLIALVNLLPVAAYFLLGLSFSTLAILFWVEVTTIILCYAGITMLAPPEDQPERRDSITHIGPIGDRFLPDAAWQLGRTLPPIYPKNLRFVAPTVLALLLLTVAVGGALSVSGWGIGRREGGNVLEFFSLLSVLGNPSVLAITLCIVAAHLIVFWQSYGREGRYSDLTAYMVLEIPVSYVVVYFLFFLTLVLCALVTAGTIELLIRASGAETTGRQLWELLMAGLFLGPKLAIERSRLRGENNPGLEDDSFTATFSPSWPPADDAAEAQKQ